MLKVVLLLAFLGCFAGNLLAQDFDFLAHQIDFGSVESKRDALYQIKLIQTAEASRIATPALRDSNDIVRATAAFAVIYLSADEAAQALLPNLSDRKSILVRQETAYALGKTRSKIALPALLNSLKKDKDIQVRSACAVALGELGDIRAINDLALILQKKPRNSEEFLRRAAARSIGQINQFNQVSSNYVVTPESPLPDEYDTLANLKYSDLPEKFPGYRQAVSVIISVVQNPKDSNDVRREAAFALGTFGNTAAIATLQQTLSATDYFLAEIAKEGLRKISRAAQVNQPILQKPILR